MSMRSRKKKMAEVRAAKDAKMKKVAIGLSVVLVAVLAFEVPKVMHSGGSPAAAPATTTTSVAPAAGTTATGGTTAPVATPASTGTAVVTATSTKLTNSDEAPKAGKAQLYSFSHFTGRDPFAQQLVATSAAQTQTSSSSSSSSSSSTSSGTSTSASTGTTAAVTHHQATRTLSVTGAARIAVNGQVQVVRVGASFPSANPLFRLVSVTNGVAKIGIAGGSYSSGAKTISLRTGRPLTLVDTADGIRYQIRLVA